MEQSRHMRMQELLEQQTARQTKLDAVKARTDLRIAMPLFDIKYRFARPEEAAHITEVLEKVPFSAPGEIDPEALAESRQTEKPTHAGRAWIVFLGAPEVYRGLYVRGSVTDIVQDYPLWREKVCGRLLLLLGDDRHVAVIAEHGVTEGVLA